MANPNAQSETKIPDDLNRLGRLALIKRVATLEVREKRLREEITGLHHDLETVRSAARIYREERDSLRAQLAEAQRPVSDFMQFICGAGCKQCAEGKPMLVNSAGFYSHKEDGNHCNNHSIYKAYDTWSAARAAKATKHGNPNGE